MARYRNNLPNTWQIQAVSLATLTRAICMTRELHPSMDEVGLHNYDVFDVSDCSGRHIFAEPWSKLLSSYAKVVKYHIADIVACSAHRLGDLRALLWP